MSACLVQLEDEYLALERHSTDGATPVSSCVLGATLKDDYRQTGMCS